MSKYEKPYPHRQPFLVPSTDAHIIYIRQATRDGCVGCHVGGVMDMSYPNSLYRRTRVKDDGKIVSALTAGEGGMVVYEGAEEVTLGRM